MARQGLNGTFSYSDGSSARTYQFRAGMLGYGTDMIYAEDQARISRSFYPHRSATQQFSVQVLLKDWDERSDFVSWMMVYAQSMLDPNVVRTTFPFMQVVVPVRAFAQQGVPLTGYEWGAHAGMMAFSPVFVFEAAQSPGQVNSQVVTSSVTGTASAYASDPAIQYFYPFSTQLEASQVPQDYSQVIPPVSALPVVTPVSAPPVPVLSTPAGQAALATGPVVASGPTLATYPPPGRGTVPVGGLPATGIFARLAGG
jgi:hypothetical protein